jgi:methyltransferase (TIGR00027 family)
MINNQFPTPTSLYVAASRAVGAMDPDPAVRNPDFLARALLGPASAIHVDHPVIAALDSDYTEAMRDPEVSGMVRRLMVRTRFIDEGLLRAVSGGVTQVAIIGAGLDSRAQRFRSLLEHVTVFEVDHPDALAFKRSRLQHALGKSDAARFVPFDYRRNSLSEALRSCGWSQSGNAFFIWEGNTMYLPEDAVRATLEFVAAHPAGSRIVFDYVTSPAIAVISRLDVDRIPAEKRPALQRVLKMNKQEPWIFGLPDLGEREYLSAFGLDVLETLHSEGPEAVKRFLTRADGSEVGTGVLKGFPYFLAEAVVR